MGKCKSFKPLINKASKILILGSMPGIKSLEMNQYYAHPQNRFWKLMGKFCGYDCFEKIEYEKRTRILLENKIALWDVIATCERIGSLDSDIKKEVVNNIPKLLKENMGIEIICLNGNKSYSEFKKHFPSLLTEYKCYKMPSTSPANAKVGFEDLYIQWKKIFSE